MSEPPVNGGGGENVGLGSKRQRRPNVRLGEIGDQPSYDQPRTKQWTDSSSVSAKRHKDTTAGKSTRPSLNGDNNNTHDETLEAENKKPKRGGATKRVRSNWPPKLLPPSPPDADNDKFSAEEEEEASASASQQNPAAITISDRGDHGTDKQELLSGKRKSAEYHHHDSKGGADATTFWSPQDGVQMWLNGLGLAQYAPVFEIHEVDEEVLPQLTLDDLKDMGINAVGSRRKLYSAIQKLAKGFS